MTSLIQILALFFSLQHLAFASNVEKHCQLPDVHSVENPYDPDQAGPKFTYKFKLHQSKVAHAPTLIYIPGGPGGPMGVSMGQDVLRYPSSMNIILTDPRGLGCNEGPKGGFPPEFYSTKNVASDIVSIVRALNLKDYILYGISYGTMVATTAAYEIQKENLPLPRMVVLEGTVGHSMKSGEGALGYSQQWERVISNLSHTHPAAVQRLKESQPLDLPGDIWGTTLQYFLLGGKISLKADQLFEGMACRLGLKDFTIEMILSTLQPGFPSFPDFCIRSLIKNLAQEWGRPASLEEEKLYRQIVCREVSEEVTTASGDFKLELLNGVLHAPASNFCGQLKLDRPFDSSDYQIKAPITYFQGEFDPSTPLPQALEHFYGQISSPRTFVTVREGGHGALSYNLRDCEKDIWSQLIEDPSKLKEVLPKCHLKTDVLMSNSAQQ